MGQVGRPRSDALALKERAAQEPAVTPIETKIPIETSLEPEPEPEPAYRLTTNMFTPADGFTLPEVSGVTKCPGCDRGFATELEMRTHDSRQHGPWPAWWWVGVDARRRR